MRITINLRCDRRKGLEFLDELYAAGLRAKMLKTGGGRVFASFCDDVSDESGDEDEDLEIDDTRDSPSDAKIVELQALAARAESVGLDVKIREFNGEPVAYYTQRDLLAAARELGCEREFLHLDGWYDACAMVLRSHVLKLERAARERRGRNT